MRIDPVTLEVLRHAMEGVADEMGAVLRRTSYSPNIKEREDCSAAVFDAAGELVAQAEHVPVHLGSMPASVDAALRAYPDLRPGDQVLLNDPFAGGTHLNDLTLVRPVFAGGERVGFVANRAHHTDVGGRAAGSMPAGAVEIFEEGVRIPPVLLIRGGAMDPGILRIVTANSRTPHERTGDLLAQAGSNERGAVRLAELAARHGNEGLADAQAALCDYAEKRVRIAVGDLPDGTWSFNDSLDDDGAGGGPVTIRCDLTIAGSDVTVDLSRSDRQVRGSVNCVEAVAVSAACFVLRCLIPEDVPVNAGCWRPLEVVAPAGSVVNARPPAAVGAGNVECSQRICDAVFGAFALVAPDRVPAASQGTMNNLLVGSAEPAFTYYETTAGGQGAGSWGPGADGVHTNMTNTRNTPVEALEHAYPMRIVSYELRDGSGGEGRHRGGDGVVREIEIRCERAEVTFMCDRRVTRPWGAAGGGPGATGRNLVDGREVAGKTTIEVRDGTRLRIDTPGGGGWGAPG